MHLVPQKRQFISQICGHHAAAADGGVTDDADFEFIHNAINTDLLIAHGSTDVYGF